MSNILLSSTPATVVLDYTNDLSLLGVGLFSLTALAAAMIALAAIWHHRSQTSKSEIATALPPDYYDTAA